MTPSGEVSDPTYANPTSISFLRAIGWIDLIAGIITAFIIFANAKKTVPGEYLPFTRVTLPSKEVTDPFAIGLAIAVAFQGITVAVLFSVIATLAENVIAIRRRMSATDEPRAEVSNTVEEQPSL